MSLTPVTLVIAAATVVALGLRLYQLSRPGFLLGVTEYDDGPYFGSALHLVNGSPPYRDFLIVQPPGITLLMLPAALLSKAVGTAWAMAAGRILTCGAGAASVVLAGLLVRHRGLFATLVVCGICAVYPDSVQAAHTVLVEPWLVLFCLLGAVAVFDGDRLTAIGRRLAWGGAAFGFAGAIEVWAIAPVVVIALLSLRRPRKLAVYLGGAAAAFLVTVVPFAALGPRQFYDGVVAAQVGHRVRAARAPLWARLKEMTGLSDWARPSHLAIMVVILLIVGAVAGGLALASGLTRRPPSALEAFAILTAGLVVAMFLWPAQFHYHFGAFLAPFLAMALALPASRLLRDVQPDSRPDRRRQPRGSAAAAWSAAGAAGLVLIVMAAVQLSWESRQLPKVPRAVVASATRLIPPGACVVTDEVSFTIMADRFISSVPGCPSFMDSTGTDFALSGGRLPATGAGRSPQLLALWHALLGHAQYVWLSRLEKHRIPWSPSLRSYFRSHFALLEKAGTNGVLYRRSAP